MENKIIFGHHVEGGGATVENSPITMNLHVHIHSSDVTEEECQLAVGKVRNAIQRALGIAPKNGVCDEIRIQD